MTINIDYAPWIGADDRPPVRARHLLLDLGIEFPAGFLWHQATEFTYGKYGAPGIYELRRRDSFLSNDFLRRRPASQNQERVTRWWYSVNSRAVFDHPNVFLAAIDLYVDIHGDCSTERSLAERAVIDPAQTVVRTLQSMQAAWTEQDRERLGVDHLAEMIRQYRGR